MLLLIPLTALAAVILGFRALAEVPPNTYRLKLAFGVLAAPWAFLLISAMQMLLTFGRLGGISYEEVLVLSPAAAVALLIGWVLRRNGMWGESPSAEYLAWRATRPAEVTTDDRAAPLRPDGSITNLRLPGALRTAVAVAILVYVGWAFSRPQSDRGVSVLLAELMITFGTMFASVMSIVCALVFSIGRRPVAAALYSALAVTVIAGDVCLLLLDDWIPSYRELNDSYTRVALMMSIVALVPALIAQIADGYRRWTELRSYH